MALRITSLLVTLVLVGSSSAAAQSPAVKPTARPAKVAGTQLEPQPRLVALDIEKCIRCATSVRKRLGVMPVKVGVVASELGLPGELVGARVRDALEAVIAGSGKVLVVNRSDLGDVLAEQRLAASGAANSELAPAARAIIPAQILLYAGVDRADVSIQTTSNSNNTAQEYYRLALQKEQEATVFERRARDTQASFDRESMTSHRPGFADGLSQMVDSITDCSTRPTPGLVQSCESQKRLNEQNRLNAERRRSEVRSRHHSEEMSRLQAQASTLRGDADMLRRKAEIESRREVTQTKTTTLNLALSWRAIDTGTGAVVASGQVSALRALKEEGVSTQAAFHSSEQTSSTRRDALVNATLDDAMAKMLPEIDTKLAPVPFRAKVAKTDTAGVFINAGANLGISIGDTFGVREKSESLTDPDTGELLSAPGAPVGYLRVVEVFEKTARAEILNRAVPVKRGDELEWIGVFVPAGSVTNGGVR
jgi:hypothetical protein